MAYYEAIQAMLQDPRLPACAAACIDAICPRINATESCICPSRRLHYAPWEPDLSDCVYNGCYQAPYLEFASLTYHADGATIEIFSFAIRVWAMRMKGHTRGYDDITISIAFVLLMIMVVILSLAQHYGLLWSTLEVFTAFVIACLPSTRLFVQHFFPVVATKFTTAVSSKRTSGSAGTAVELGDRRRKMTGPTMLASKDPEPDEIPLRTVENEQPRVGYSMNV